ncbi:MAG: 30S ribosomal protein S6 [Acidobacteria bacterium]|nr:30S ribosomal protein S6 [Acidobacteriota bacterium]
MNNLRTYELLYIISPTVPDQQVEKLADQVKDHITNLGATVTKVEKLGRRRLAYEIKHHREGTYILTQFQSQGREIPELERRLRVMDNVLRYLTVCLDPDLRRIERMRRKRAQRRAVKAQTTPMGEPLNAEVFDDEEPVLEVEEEL